MRALILILSLTASVELFAESMVPSFQKELAGKSQKVAALKDKIKELKKKQEVLLKEFSKSQKESDYANAMGLTHQMTILEHIETQVQEGQSCEDSQFSFQRKFNRSESKELTVPVKDGLEIIKILCKE